MDEIRTITSKELQELLHCSYHTAVKIGTEANARIQFGRSVRWRVKNIQAYLDKIQEEEKI